MSKDAEVPMEFREAWPPVTDVKPGDIVYCKQCQKNVAVTRIEGDSIYHFNASDGKEQSCPVSRRQVVVISQLTELEKLLFKKIERLEAFARVTQRRLDMMKAPRYPELPPEVAAPIELGE